MAEHGAEPCGCGARHVLRPQPRTHRDKRLARLRILACKPAVGARFQPRGNGSPAFAVALLDLNIFLHRDRIEPRRHHRAREDADGTA